ncbi:MULTISPECIES: ester cyclase [Mycobacterium]|uniref:Ester cyclase n=1 Tax=Mycobacterium syngnathidarum TaxID=1908205 RepID=A0A1Q9WGJ9_9MYCO|nr:MULTISPECIES: ester cyclase [Mycobacterium]MCG7611528.1 ester cyclase [Mycobacterium sp. CnD-18-1]OHT78434.1 hypothetical protein BKG61_30230 [Mycobacterium syngnathidarum]OLT97894.1 hypothetical protein BKG60_03830 [Mycobacterium syngnathidarum]
MSEDKTTELARRFVEAAWSNSGGYATLEALAAPEFSVKYSLMPAPIEGVEAYCALLRQTRASLEDIYIKFVHVATQGNTAVFSWEGGGTHKGEIMGIPGTGGALHWTGISIVEVTDGKVTKEWGEEDSARVLRQLGVIPAGI